MVVDPTMVVAFDFPSAATYDHTFLKRLELEKGSFVVFDKAYNGYNQYPEKYQDIRTKKIS